MHRWAACSPMVLTCSQSVVQVAAIGHDRQRAVAAFT
jgi:hypothetical protein